MATCERCSAHRDSKQENFETFERFFCHQIEDGIGVLVERCCEHYHLELCVCVCVCVLCGEASNNGSLQKQPSKQDCVCVRARALRVRASPQMAYTYTLVTCSIDADTCKMEDRRRIGGRRMSR